MTDFLLLSSERSDAPADARAMLEAREAFTSELRRAGALLDTERLRPSSEGVRITTRDGASRVVAGPFADAIGTYWVVRANDLEAALTLARTLPTALGERVDLRPVMKGEHEPGKTNAQGKVFAFGVLGAAPNEAAWEAVMDRIDADTQDGFGDAFIAGLRLQPPRSSAQFVNQHGKAVVLDGPFLESREVIGGLFFMRFPGLDDAIAWAATTAFARLGTIEVREVWRA